MRTGTLALSAAFALTLCGTGWLWLENDRLREQVADTSAIRSPAHSTARNIASSPGGGIGGFGQKGPAAGKDPVGGQDSRKAVFIGGAAAALASPLRITDNGDGSFTVSDPGGTWRRVMTPEALREFGKVMNSALQIATTKMPGGPSWSPGQAAGAPNTAHHGDYSTAWASQSPDAGKEWLQMKYAKPVEIGEINIHETYNPGAISKVSALMPDGSERVIWEGTMDADTGVIERAVKVPPGIRSDQIRVELDTSRVPGWNEIDAVEIVGTDGSRQWASESTASSYYGQGRDKLSVRFDSGLVLEDAGFVNESTVRRP